MYGYYDQRSRASSNAVKVTESLAATAVVGAFFFRHQVGTALESGLRRASQNRVWQGRAAAWTEQGLRAATRFQSYLERTVGQKESLQYHFRPGQYQIRRDTKALSEMRERLGRLYYEKDASNALHGSLLDQGWSANKLSTFFQQTGLIQEVIHRADAGQLRRSLQDVGGEFRKVLESEAEAQGVTLAQHLDRVHTELQVAVPRLPHRPRPDEVQEGELGATLREHFREQLREEVTRGPSGIERLTGTRVAPLRTTEQELYRNILGDATLAPENLRGNVANATIRGASGQEYNFSSLRSLALSGKDWLTDRIQIPMSPLQTGLTLGQLAPFLSRLGDRPVAGVYDHGFGLDSKLQVYFGKKIFTHDFLTDTAEVSRDDYTFRKSNKSYIRRALAAENAAATGAQEGSIFAQAFRGFGVEPGSIPYWDVPGALMRKFRAPDYIPNILRAGGEGHIDTLDDAIALTKVLKQTGLSLNDDSLIHLTQEIASQTIDTGTPLQRPLMMGATEIEPLEEFNQALGLGSLRRVDPAILRALHALSTQTTTNPFAKWGSDGVVHNLQEFYESRSTYTASPKIRKMMQDLRNGTESDRIRFLGQTASYEDSRRAATLFGLDVGEGTRRVTNLDILRGEIMGDLLRMSTDAQNPLAHIADRMIGRGETHAALYAHSVLFDQHVGAGDPVAVQDFLQDPHQTHLKAYLTQESRRRFSLFHLHPKEAPEPRDFGQRQRVVALRTTAHKEDGTFGWRRLWRANTAAQPIHNQDATPGSLFNYFLMDRLQSGFSDLGIGLPDTWKTSPGRLAAGMVLGRYLPLFLGIPEAHKLYNRITRDVAPLRPFNLDMHRANLLDAFGNATHGGHWRRHAVGILPGLDFYLDARTGKEERRQQATAGYTPVRKGRWWAFGSRESFFGDKVNYYLPSAARIARSDWQASENVNLNSKQYWRHFGGYLNPNNWGLGAYWWEKSQAKERPYAISGPAFDPDHPWSGPLNATIGHILKPRRIYHPEVLPKHLGGTLEEQPANDRPTAIQDPYHNSTESSRSLDRRGSSGSHSRAQFAPGSSAQTTKYIPRPSRVRDPKDAPLYDRIRLLRDLTGRQPLPEGTAQGVLPEEAAYLRQMGFSNGYERSVYHLQEIAGLYGWIGSLVAPGVAHPVGKVEIADASRGYGRERRFYDQELGGLGGSVADVLRRFLPHRRRAIAPYDPVRNAMPSWLPGSDYFVDLQHGDPYARLPMGELRLPGQAYERTHPGVTSRLLRMRASSLGKSTDEMIGHFLNKEGDGTTSTAAELGTKMHRVLQNRWRQLGLLEADEVEVFDPKLNITGHIDAIARLPNARGQYERAIVDFKTKTAARFAAIKRTGRPESENLDQILFYMHTTGIKRGVLTYINREDVNQVFQVEVKWNQRQFDAAVARLQAARTHVENLLKAGTISRGQLYDPVAKYEILSDVAPYSAEFSRIKQWVGKNLESFTQEDQARIADAETRLKKVRDGFELHAYRFSPTKTHSATVEIAKFRGLDRFEDTHGQVYRIAGTNSRNTQTEGLSTDAWWLSHTRLKTGSHVRVVTTPEDASSDPDHLRAAAVFHGGHNVGQDLINTGALEEKTDDYSSVANITRFSALGRGIGRLWESFAHLNTPFHTKFLPTRSGLEQYERTDVYGKKSGSWDSPVSSYITPTLVSLFNKNPVAGAAMGAFLGATFFPHPEQRLLAVKVGAIVGASFAVYGTIRKILGAPVIAPAVRKRRNLDTLYDTLTYVKYRRLAAQEEALAAHQEGVDVSDLESSSLKNVDKENREQISGLRSIATALQDRKKALRLALQRHPGSRISQKKRHLEIAALEEEESQTEIQQRELTRSSRYAVGHHTLQALLYRQRYRSTVRGGIDSGSWEAALAGLPKTSRSALVDVVRHGSQSEKDRLFRLLPQDQKALLGYALGIDVHKIPRLQSLQAYFRHNPLPDDTWAGWRDDASLDLIKTRDIVNHRLDPMDFGIYPNMVDQATQGAPEALIPLPNKAPPARSPYHLQQAIEDLMTGRGLSGVRVTVSSESTTSDSHEADIQVDVTHRREQNVFSLFKQSSGF